MLSFNAIFEHHSEFHPNVQYWGDSGSTLGDKAISQVCFVCGMELVKDRETGQMKSIEEQRIEALDRSVKK